MSNVPAGRPGPATDPYVPGHGDATYTVEHYDLDLDYKVSSNRLAGRAVLRLTAAEDVSRIAVDLAGLRVTKLTVDGTAAKYSHRGGRLGVTLPAALRAGDGAEVTIAYVGNPAPVRSRWGEVGWEELEDGVLVASQPSGAPTWFPCNDHPRSKSTYRIAFECDSPYVVVATGALTSTRRRGSRTRHVFEQPRPMATYLAAVHVGQYARFTLATLPVSQEVVLPPSLVRRAQTDLGRQPQMVEVFTELFGEYPYDAYTVVITADDLEIPLEAQGMATFAPNWIDGRRGEERLVAHELAHQWFGNSLTIGAWRDIWLNEGFACYAEWLWSEEADGTSAEVSARAAWAKLSRLPQDILLGDPGPALMFDDRVYKRGALTLHALRLCVGDATFFAMLRDWVARHAHGTVTTADFISHVNRHQDTARCTRLLDEWLFRLPLPPLPSA